MTSNIVCANIYLSPSSGSKVGYFGPLLYYLPQNYHNIYKVMDTIFDISCMVLVGIHLALEKLDD